jgi:hypothetical protein
MELVHNSTPFEEREQENMRTKKGTGQGIGTMKMSSTQGRGKVEQ